MVIVLTKTILLTLCLAIVVEIVLKIKIRNLVIKPEKKIQKKQPPPFCISTNPNDIKFYLFPIKGNPDFKQELPYGVPEYGEVGSVIGSTLFQPRSPTVFLVHGFRNNITTEMPQVLKNAYLASGLRYNFIAMDWGPLATPLPPEVTGPNYPRAVENVPIAAKRLRDMLVLLYKLHLIDPKTVHLIGHSLGAHVVGLAGYYFSEARGFKIGRVTGLDPAGPLFSPPSVRTAISETNADFVGGNKSARSYFMGVLYIDVIHTNQGYRGDQSIDGHFDVYPNGRFGGVSQPGCCIADGPQPDGNEELVGRCSHFYSIYLYARSITENFTACRCDPRINFFERQFCYRDCPDPVILGPTTPPSARGLYYIKTGQLNP